MNTGKTLFAQLMTFLPWTTFTRIVARYGGDCRVRRLTCAEQYRAMAFAQPTYRESLRDIETCVLAQASKLYHRGFSKPIRRSTLADANETRDWRIYAGLAERLGKKTVCRREPGPGLEQHRLCLGLNHHRPLPFRVFLGPFSLHQGSGEDASPVRPKGQHPKFHPHLGR